MKSRKELKAAYKQQKAIMGVFQIKNKANGKFLIEQSLDIPARWNRIRTELKFGSHRNKALLKDWQTHNEESFEFSILSKLTVKEEENLNLKEELKTLKEMLLEEMQINSAMSY